jgi:uncharacterized membrane protein
MSADFWWFLIIIFFSLFLRQLIRTWDARKQFVKLRNEYSTKYYRIFGETPDDDLMDIVYYDLRFYG